MSSTLSPEVETVATLNLTPGVEQVATEERRSSDRAAHALPLRLTPMGLEQSQLCHAEDISECGMYVRVSADVGLAVGQRCEIAFESVESADLPQLAGETFFATVVRTETLVQETSLTVGAGFRFDQPLYF